MKNVDTSLDNSQIWALPVFYVSFFHKFLFQLLPFIELWLPTG